MSAAGPVARPDLRPRGGAAPWWRRVLRQAGLETRTALRNGEQLLLTLVIPVVLLVAATRTRVVDLGPGERVSLAVAGVLALAVVSTAFTGQAIATGFDRRNGVLRLLATTPLGRGGLVGGKCLAVLALVAVQVVVLTGVGLLLGWHPQAAGALAAVPAVLMAHEPTVGQDRGTWAVVAGLLAAAAREGIAVGVSSHDERLLRVLDGPVVALRAGTRVAEAAA